MSPVVAVRFHCQDGSLGDQPLLRVPLPGRVRQDDLVLEDVEGVSDSEWASTDLLSEHVTC